MDLQQQATLLLLLFSTIFASILFVLVARILNFRKPKNVPPGTLGLPIIGETLQFVRARRAGKANDWIKTKVEKYGPVFKTSILGCPTVLLTGPAGNRFVFQNSYPTLIGKQPSNYLRIFGPRNIIALFGEDHKRMRGAIMQFLKPEVLQKFVGRMESVILEHFSQSWEGKDSIKVWPLMKQLTFKVACELLFSLKDNKEREFFVKDFNILLGGLWTLPFDLPGTPFRRALNARSRLHRRLLSLFEVRKREMKQGISNPSQDLISCLLSIEDENHNKIFTEEEIVDNVITSMIAGHDTTSTLLTNFIRMLALNPDVYRNIVQEQTEIAAGKQPNEALRWEDIQKMKYTWKAAQETMRLFPPVPGTFRKALKDIQYGGYTIPAGWQIFWSGGYTNMMEDIFKEPDKFEPSRMDGGIPAYAFVPFGGGGRICPGYDFAKMESMVFMHHLITRYEWSMVIPDETVTYDPVPVPMMGLPIKIKRKTSC